MDQQAQPVDAQQPPALNLLDQILARLSEYGHNARNNVSAGFDNMTPQLWIRVIVIAGGYMLLRPYLQKAVTKGAVEKMDRDDKKARGEEDTLPHPELTPNEYRGIKDKLYADDDNLGGDGSDWGQNARVRQRKMLRELLEDDERRRAAQDEDADIQEFLED